MSKLSNHIIVEAPADAVWDVVGHQFDLIGQWAAAIPASTAYCPVGPSVGAAVAGRVCRTDVWLAPEVTETIIAYDDACRTLTYEATAGMPAFVTRARNRWEVTPLDDRRARVAFEAQFDVRGVLGRVARWWILTQVGRTGRHILDDLKHYVETGAPSQLKQHQLNRDRER